MYASISFVAVWLLWLNWEFSPLIPLSSSVPTCSASISTPTKAHHGHPFVRCMRWNTHRKVNKLDSADTQIPYDYYSLPFCQPSTIKLASENLGEVLSGDRIENSPYELNFGIDETCKILCKKDYSHDELEVGRTCLCLCLCLRLFLNLC